MKIAQGDTNYDVKKIVLADGSNRVVKKLFLNTDLIYCNYTETKRGSETAYVKSEPIYPTQDNGNRYQYYLSDNNSNSVNWGHDFIISDIPDGASITITDVDVYVNTRSAHFYYDGYNMEGTLSSATITNVTHSLQGNKIHVSWQVRFGAASSSSVIDRNYVNSGYCDKRCQVYIDVEYSVYK